MGVRPRAAVGSFFPSIGVWAVPRLRTNFGHLNCAPFIWDFETKRPGTR